MKIISLTRGMVAVVDDEDFTALNQHKWHAVGSNNDTEFYAVRRVRVGDKHPAIWMHKAVMGALAGQAIDHKDGNTLDNRKQNLRPATNGVNRANAKLQKNNMSGFKGVSWSYGKWRVLVRRRTVGRFSDPIEAAKAYDKAATETFGEFARTNRSLGLIV